MRTLIALALVAGCSDPSTTVVMTVGDDAPAYGSAPFPTDALREGDRLGMLTGLETVIERNAGKVAQHIASLDGFGLRPLVEFPTTGPIDPDALTGNAFVLDLETRREIAMEWRFDAARNMIQGRPLSGELLREAATHVAFVTKDVLARSPALDELAGHARWRTTADALEALGRDDIAAFTSFTTQHATAPLVDAANVQATLPPSSLTFPDADIIFNTTAELDAILGQATRATEGPRAGLERWGNDNPTGIAHDHVGVIASGVMTSARFRRPDTGTNEADDETFTTPPTLVAMEDIPVTFILPSSPMPASGYPIIIYGHGLGASRDQLLSFAEPLTSRGYAIVGIDMTGHGSRFLATDQYANMANQLASFTGEAGTRDGFGDTTGQITQFDFFEGFLGVGAVRDSIRQSALDLSRLAQLLRTDLDLSALAGPGSANPTLDTTRIAYLGESFGTVVGTLFSAIDPTIGLYVLDVPGGGILDTIFTSSPEIGGPAMPLIEGIYYNLLPLDRWNPLIGLMQAVIDGADPLSYAPHILSDRFTIAGTPLPPRSVVAIEVMGDQVLSNAGTEALARGMKLDVLTPDLATPVGLDPVASPASGNRDGQTAVLVQYAPATHGGNWSSERGTLKYMPGFPFEGEENVFPKLPKPVSIVNPIYETHEQVAEILATYFAGKPPVVRSTLAPVADFDDDGTPDAADPDPFDPGAR